MFDLIDVVTPPLDEPVTLAQAKAQGRDIPAEDDEVYQQKLISARERGEHFTRRSFCTQTLDVWYSNPSGVGYFELPRGKVQSIVAVYVYDVYGVEYQIDPAMYTLLRSDLVLNDWLTDYRPRFGIKIRLISGYGDPEDVPVSIKEGILEYAYFSYEHREGEATDAHYEVQAKGSAGLPQGVYDKWKTYQLAMV